MIDRRRGICVSDDAADVIISFDRRVIRAVSYGARTYHFSGNTADIFRVVFTDIYITRGRASGYACSNRHKPCNAAYTGSRAGLNISAETAISDRRVGILQNTRNAAYIIAIRSYRAAGNIDVIKNAADREAGY